MKVVKPTPIVAAILVSTDATEPHSAWAAASAYSVGDKRILTSTQRIYYRLLAGTSATSPDADAVNWLDVGPTNTWAMFDGEISTQTSKASSLTVVLKPGYTNSLALFNLEGASLAITVRDALAGAIVYGDVTLTGPKLINLDGTVITDWYQYFFEAFVQRSEVVLTDLPTYSNAHITITLSGGTTVKCGNCLVGTFYDLGGTQYGATVGITDYSRKDTDAFGVTTFTRRAYSKRMSARMMLANTQINKVQRVLADLRATPCAWIGTDADGFEPLTVYGFYKDFSIDVAYATTSYCTTEIEGLT